MNSKQFKLLIIIQIITLLFVLFCFVAVLNIKDKSIEKKSTRLIKTKNNLVVDYGSNYLYGKTSFKNELIVFSRFNCAYCCDFYNEVFDSLKSKYVNTGILKIVFFDNLKKEDKLGILMSKVVEISKECNLYEVSQRTFYSLNGKEDSLSIVNSAIKIGIPLDLLKSKINSFEVISNIDHDMKESFRLQFTATPVFIINGRVIVGYKGYESFMNEIEIELSKKTDVNENSCD